jgi:putative ABC transport system permease protein
VMDRIPVTVIGVMPEAFDLFGDRVEFFAPLCLTRAQVQSSQGALTIVGRLKPGVSLQQAQTEMDILVAQLALSDPERHKGTGIRLEPLQRALYADYRSPLLMLQVAVAFVLLIGCANVAGLLLARATRRRSEVALRLAMGAHRSRIVRQLLVENVPLAVLGGLLGLVLARGGLALFVLAAPADFPRINGLSLDVRVLAFTLLVALSTAVVFALVPAIQISKASLLEPLKEARRTTDGIHRQRLRNVLATGQMALACVLLIGAGLMIQSFVRILDADLGADPRNVLVFDFRFPQSEALKPVSRYRGVGLWRVSDTPAQTFDRVRERLQSVPGVVDVAAVNAPPFGDQTMRVPFLIEGRTSAGRDALGDGGSSLTTQQMAHYYAVTPGFLRTMKIGLRAGRDFTPYDTARAPLVVIINEAMARQYFPGEDAVGKRVIVDFVPDEQPREIIGVAADTAVGPLKRESAPALYVPHVQQTAMWLGPRWTYRAGMYFVVRGSGNPLRLTEEIKRAVGEVDRNTPVADVRTVEQGISAQLQNLRTYMLLLTVFGAIAVVLAGIGVYGVIANAMAERTREFGIRMAFGAGVGDIIGIVARQAAWLVGGGLVIGAFGAMTVTRLLAANVSGVSSADAGTYGLGLLLLILVGCVACVIPAWRAARVAPGVALNYE